MNNSTKGIVKFSENWADECDFHGFYLVNNAIEIKQDMDEYRRKGVYGGRIMFGTNEFNDYNNADDFWDCWTVECLTEQEYMTIRDIFGMCYGNYVNPFDCID